MSALYEIECSPLGLIADCPFLMARCRFIRILLDNSTRERRVSQPARAELNGIFYDHSSSAPCSGH